MPDPTQLGHYLIKGLLRHGRSADSYFAENASMRSQKVLLRVLHEDTASDPAFVQSFLEEARIAARLDHTCIASVLDLKHDGERIYAVLEFIEGLDLGEILQQFGPPPPEVAVAIMREVCSALEHAHGKSVLHRRLRPRLVKVTSEGGVKVLGFGLRERESFLQSAVMPDLMREELYRPPEQVREEPQDVRSDLYTLAVIIWELLAGRMPFDSIVGPAGRAPARKPPSIFEHNPLVPAAFGRLLERMLAERREDRPADAAEVRRMLDDLLDEYRVMHTSDLLQLYLGNPPDYTTQAKQRSLEHMLRDAEKLSKGSDAERRAAIEELDRILAADPTHRQAQSLVRRIKPASDPGKPAPAAPAPGAPAETFDPDKTVLDIPGSSPEPPRAVAPPPPPPPPAAAPKRAPEPAVLAGAHAAPPPPPARPPAPPRRAPAPDPIAKWRGPLVLSILSVVLLAIAFTLFVWRPWAPPAPPIEAFTATAADSTLRLDVDTEPPGAQVMLPSTGETRVSPTWFENLRPGPVRVRVTLPGYLTRDTTLELAAGQPGALHLDLVSLASLACTLFVAVTPRADQVLVDGLPATMADSASWFMDVEPGTHSVEITAQGYEKWSNTRAAKVEAGTNARVRVTLQPGLAGPVAAETLTTPPPPAATVANKPWQVAGGSKVIVECEPEAQLWVDGVLYPTLVKRADLFMAPDREHRFRFVHPDYLEAVQIKKVRKGKTEHVRQDFRVGSGILSISARQGGGFQVFVRGRFRGYTPLVVRDVDTGRCPVELRAKDGKTVLGRKEVMVSNSSVPIQVQF